MGLFIVQFNNYAGKDTSTHRDRKALFKTLILTELGTVTFHHFQWMDEKQTKSLLLLSIAQKNKNTRCHIAVLGCLFYFHTLWAYVTPHRNVAEIRQKLNIAST